MDKIIITFDAQDTLKFNILINDVLVSYQLINNQIIIEHDILFGLNLLKIKLIQGSKVILTDLNLNGVSNEHTLYLTYYENPNTNSTWLTEASPDLIIPFGNPMSWWLCECARKIPNTYYGTNLYEKFDIFYSKAIQANTSYPKLLQDFMRYTVGFHVNEKNKPMLHNKTLPWIKINLDYNEQQLLEEFHSNEKLLENKYFRPGIGQFNTKESEKAFIDKYLLKPHKTFPNLKVIFEHNTTKDKAIPEFQEQDLPHFFKLIKQIESMGIEIIMSYISTVYPNSYVAPHVDDFYKRIDLYSETSGCSQFAIPIGWKDNNYFKFDNVGFLPYEQGAFLINNSDFTHASINNSDAVRFTIGIYCRFTEENIQTLITL